MDVSWKSLQYLHAWEHELPIEQGVAWADELRQCRLDYSVESLTRIDGFLDQLRTQQAALSERDVWTPQFHALLRLLAFYVGEVIARSSQRSPQWLTFEQFIQRYGGDPADSCLEHSLVLIDGNIVFMPLVSIVERATEASGRKSVRSSACALIAAELQSGPRAAQPLRPWPAPAWTTETRSRITAAPAAVLGVYELEEPHWASGDDLHRLFIHAPELLRTGEVVWGAVVQANGHLFDPSGLLHDGGAPAEILYDPQGRAPRDGLCELAKAVFACKGRASEDPQTAQVSKHLAAEITRTFAMDVPLTLSSYPLKLSTTWVSSRYLHLRHLVMPSVPLLISRDLPGVVLPVPSSFWPEDLLQEWESAARRQRRPHEPLYVPPRELEHMQPSSLVEEAHMYFEGKGVLQDLDKARQTWEKAAQQGSFTALRRLAQLYERGQGVERDWRKAVIHYELAAESGCQESRGHAERLKVQLQMATAFPGVQPDSGTPDDWCDRAVQMLKDKKARRHLEEALMLLERGAKRGHRESLFNLGVVHHNGDFFPRKGRVAMGYLQRAADRGHPVATQFVAARKRTLMGLWEWYFRAR